jgi:hypothetical protein
MNDHRRAGFVTRATWYVEANENPLAARNLGGKACFNYALCKRRRTGIHKHSEQRKSLPRRGEALAQDK